jgi:hypothetical protein
VQYLIGLTLLGVLLFVGRRRRTAVVFLGFACANLVVVVPLYSGRSSVPMGASPRLRAMLLNVNTRLGDANRVRKAISDAAPDILVLEVRSPELLTSFRQSLRKARSSLCRSLRSLKWSPSDKASDPSVTNSMLT